MKTKTFQQIENVKENRMIVLECKGKMSKITYRKG